MLRGQLQPYALQEAGKSREQFLFTVEAVEIVARLTGSAGKSINQLL